MFNQQFKNNFPIATNFFETAFSQESRKLSHAFLLTGSDQNAQYYLALKIAKRLNCLKNGQEANCDCINCSWIDNNKHPAVITISPIDFTEGKEGNSKTVISVDQARYLKNTLANSSQYHRVIIFTDAAEGDEYYRLYKESVTNYPDVCPPSTKLNNSDEERIWIPKPLSYKVFQDSTANALLKTIEEPGANVTFFFLTKDKEEMINTIVSRCQTIPVYSNKIKTIDMSILDDFLSSFPPKTEKEAMMAAEQLLDISKQQSYPIEELLDMIQEYLRLSLQSNNTKNYAKQITKYIQNIENTKMQLSSYVTTNAALESLFFGF